MASPKGDQREQVRSAAASEVLRWERLLADELTALWTRQEAVVLVRLQGTKARKHTRHWSPTPTTDEVKVLDPSYIVDLARWLLQAVNVVSTLLRRLYEDVILTVLKQLGILLDGVTIPGVDEPAPAADRDERPKPKPPARSTDTSRVDVPNGPLPGPASTAVREAARDVAAAVTGRVERADEGPRAPGQEDGPQVPVEVVEAHLRARIETVARGVQAAAEEVQAVIAQAEEQDAPLAEIAEKVRTTYATRSKTWTARAVNATVVGAMNESSLMAATAAGVGKKQWLASHDTRVRHSHREADGDVVDIDAPFDLAGGQVAYPGDPAGPAAEVINCRCTLLFPLPGQPKYDRARFAKTLPVFAAAQSPRTTIMEGSDG